DTRAVTDVLTLIAAASEPRLDDAAAAVQTALAGLGAGLGKVDALAPGRACDIVFAGLSVDQADAAARHALAGAGLAVDAVAQPAAGRRKQLLLADMESTVIENEMLDELADCLGLRAEVAEI